LERWYLSLELNIVQQLKMETTEEKYYAPFGENNFLHVYNRTNSEKDLLFYKKKNYSYFLRKYHEYLSTYLDTYAFCLIPNHFHLMVRVKSIEKLAHANTNESIAEQFRKFFISFSQAINKQEGRRGSLFQKRFKRVAVKDASHFTQLIYYIHFNPVYHKIVKNLADYRWSSYKAILSTKRTEITRKKVLEWFGNRNQFEDFHVNYQIEKVKQYLMIEN